VCIWRNAVIDMVSKIGSILGWHSFFLSLCMSNEWSGRVMICSHTEVMCESLAVTCRCCVIVCRSKAPRELFGCVNTYRSYGMARSSESSMFEVLPPRCPPLVTARRQTLRSMDKFKSEFELQRVCTAEYALLSQPRHVQTV
jgi:hypothetical protein